MDINSKKNRKVDLIPLIDIVFILVIFFMINNITVQSENQERRFPIPTPKNQRGSNAQVLVQIIDEQSFFWLDHTNYNTIEDELSKVWLPLNKRYANLDRKLGKTNIYKWISLDEKLETLFRTVKKNNEECFIVIRCPNSIPYFKVIEIIKKINKSNVNTVEYGCVGGRLADLFTPGSITVEQKVTGNTTRDLIRIKYN